LPAITASVAAAAPAEKSSASKRATRATQPPVADQSPSARERLPRTIPVDDSYWASRLFGPSSRVRSGSQRRFAEGRLALRDALQELDTHVVELDPVLLVNVNTVADLLALTP
jgi:hypothetical protein